MRGYSDETERRHWTTSASGGWTFAEARLVAKHLPTGGRVLVVGCGGGRELVALRRDGATAVGIELVPDFLEAYVREHRGEDRQSVARADMAQLPFRDGAFDLVLLFNQVLGHGPRRIDRIHTLQECFRVVRPGGHVLLSIYIGAVEDDSLLLEAWSLWIRRSKPRLGSSPGAAGPVGPLAPTRVRLRRHLRAWLRGKATRTHSVESWGAPERGRPHPSVRGDGNPPSRCSVSSIPT